MTALEQKLIDAGTALALSVGHVPSCTKVKMQVMCNCGCGQLQAKALDDWLHVMAEVRNHD